MGRSKDLKKLKKNIESGLNLASPRANNSRNSSKRDSPSMKYFEQMKPQSPTMFKNIKSPRKTTEKGVKGSIHQYYLWFCSIILSNYHFIKTVRWIHVGCLKHCFHLLDTPQWLQAVWFAVDRHSTLTNPLWLLLL